MQNAFTPEQREKLEKMREQFPRRADAVVQYLAGQRDVDFNRIHMIGLGEQKPADTGRTREARARNRRVEVKIYSADEALASEASSC